MTTGAPGPDRAVTTSSSSRDTSHAPSRTRRWDRGDALRLALSVAILAALALPATATALKTSYSRTGGLEITAAPGERNSIEAGFFGAPPSGFLPFEYRVSDVVPIAASSGCSPAGAAVKCRITGIRPLTVELLDGSVNTFRYVGDADVRVGAGGGADGILTAAGFDLLDSGAGDDSLRAGDGDDVLRAGDGNDELVGEGGDDLLEGGTGGDRFFAGPGDDELLARDGVPDTIDCGAGVDSLLMDLKDGRPPGSCERVDQSAKDEAPNVRVLSRRAAASRSGAIPIRLACPRAVRGGCAGTLAVKVRRAGSVKRRFRIGHGRRARVRLRLRATARRVLARGGRLRARLVSVEEGVHGPKTTIRPLRIRRKRGSRIAAERRRPRSAATSSAATGSAVSFIVGEGLRIDASAGVKNDVTITSLTGPARLRVRDDAAPVAAGAGCATGPAGSVTCRLLGPRTIRAALGDRDDRLAFGSDSAGGADAVLDGGTSFDTLRGSDGYDVLIGGTVDQGADVLDGKGGNDALLGGPGDDRLTGGLGNDYATGDSGSDRLFLRDGRVDRWCDASPALLEVDGPDPGQSFAGDTAICPADQLSRRSSAGGSTP